MKDAIESLVATTYDALATAIARTCLAGPPLVHSRSTDRAIEALAGYALGVFAAGIASRLSLGASLDRASQIRAALYRETGTITAVVQRLDLDAILDDDCLVTAAALRMHVAARLRASRADGTRIITALVDASAADPAWLARTLGELAKSDLVATRFADHVEHIWALLHGGTTYVAAPKVATPAYSVIEIR